jgi:hypothetical protein
MENQIITGSRSRRPAGRGAAAAPGADHETTLHVKLCSIDGRILDATTSGFD